MIEKEGILAFLQQSNFIEGVYDAESLNQAMQAWKRLPTISQKLTGAHVRQTHDTLMLNHLTPWDRGRYRTERVYIGGREGLNATLIPAAMESWLGMMNNSIEHQENDQIFWESHSKHLHIEYEQIHPFIDGNGRTGRMFMNWYRLKVGLPILILWESEKQDYYKWFV